MVETADEDHAPEYYRIFGKLVRQTPRDDGSASLDAVDPNTGEFVESPQYWGWLFSADDAVEPLTEDEFSAELAKLRKQLQ